MKKQREEEAWAVTSPGLEAVCQAELEALGLQVDQSLTGGVAFRCDRAGLYRANVWLRCASRVLVRVGSARCRDFPALYRQAVKLPWGRYLKVDTPVDVRVTAHLSRLNHSDRIAETVQQAVVHALGEAPQNRARPAQQILVRLEQDEATFSVDSSGPLLHRRGYRQEQGAAPLRETLAAGLLALAGWTPSTPLWDPLCGAGTLVIEAGLIASGRPPALEREYAFQHWPKYYPAHLKAVQDEDQIIPITTTLLGTDRDPQIIAKAQRNGKRAQVARGCRFEAVPLGGDLDLPADPGLILTNPPYGERLSQPQELIALYRHFAKLLAGQAKGWRCVLLAPDLTLVQKAGLKTSVIRHLRNGGLKVALIECSL